MPRQFCRYDPDQTLLLPLSLREWRPEDHLELFFSDFIDTMYALRLYVACPMKFGFGSKLESLWASDPKRDPR